MSRITTLATVLAGALATTVALCSAAGAAETTGSEGREAQRPPQRTCFWTERLAAKFDSGGSGNYAYPDSGAVYWTSKVTMPPGSKILLRGRFAHARYQSINSYNAANAAPTDALNDVSTRPDRGSENPYLPGADRTVRKRSYGVTVLNEPPPPSRAPNTVYAGVDGQDQVILFYRVYLPDSFTRRDLTGGVGLPEANLKLADGTVLRGRDACRAMNVERGQLTPDSLPLDAYQSFREQDGKPDTFPAEPTPLFRTFYSKPWGLSCWYLGICSGLPVRVGGQYSNVDNEYLVAFANRSFDAGPVLVLRGKLPRTPNTGRKVNRMPRGQLRYWSICQNESVYTTASSGCLYDAQIPVDRHGRYTIVSSKAADRPANARRKCGVGYLPWPERGDGAGHLDDGMLIVRNMLPSKGFDHAIQDTSVPGDEAEVLGSYMPKGHYETKAEFRDRGC